MFPTLVDILMLLSHTRSCWRKIVHSDSNIFYGLVDQFVQPQPEDDAALEGENWSSLSGLLCNEVVVQV